mgnify:CR=1 FL=1|tara:strand:- start:2 stop:286 length:285 start_codon:yes stop_codon:yes gene_type:complete
MVRKEEYYKALEIIDLYHKQKIDDLITIDSILDEVSVRLGNCLIDYKETFNIKYLNDIEKRKVMRFNNFGRKSLIELDEIMIKYKINFNARNIR